MTKATFLINDRWRLSEEGELQWIPRYPAQISACAANTPGSC